MPEGAWPCAGVCALWCWYATRMGVTSRRLGDRSSQEQLPFLECFTADQALCSGVPNQYLSFHPHNSERRTRIIYILQNKEMDARGQPPSWVESGPFPGCCSLPSCCEEPSCLGTCSSEGSGPRVVTSKCSHSTGLATNLHLGKGCCTLPPFPSLCICYYFALSTPANKDCLH